MNIDTYLNQTLYFSESEGQLCQISSLPYKRAAYSYRKCLATFGEAFVGTPLEIAFLRYLEPTPKEIREALNNWGKVCHLYRLVPMTATRKIKGVAKRAGIPVETKKVELARGLGWIEAEVVAPKMTVRVKGKTVA
jgi:hypothetical protein